MATNPMHQFEVYRVGPEISIGGINLSFTNASLFMLASSLLILLMLFLGTKKKLLVPTKMQLMAEMSYTFIAKMINDTAGSKAKPFFPFIFTLFKAISSRSVHDSFRSVIFLRDVLREFLCEFLPVVVRGRGLALCLW